MVFRFSFRRYSLPFRRPVRTSRGFWALREGLYLRTEREDGVVGWGEAAPLPSFGTESVDEAEEGCRALGDRFADDVLAVVPENLFTVRNALTAALTSEADAPLRLNLGVAALLPAGRGALAEAPTKAEVGFRVFKWKVGIASADDEMAMLDDLLGGLPNGSKVRLDANGAWDLRTAARWLGYAADRPIEFVEQPLAADSKGAEDNLFGLAADYPVPIALDESIARDSDVQRWLGRGWSGFFVIKPSLLGDIAASLADLASAESRVVFSSGLETGLGARAGLRWAFEWPGKPFALGYGVWPLFLNPSFDGPAAAPFLQFEDVKRINPEAFWNALN